MANEEILLAKLNELGDFENVLEEFTNDQLEVIYAAMNQVKNNGVLADVMPRIDNFKCEHGYLYECWDEDILTEITDKGYVKFYILDYGLKAIVQT